MPSTSHIILRIVLSCILAGLIGIERETVNRPAGFRTHILVCVGSAIVMLTGIFLLNEYKYVTTLDPARLGAQVISGIGFLGAGTILREGLTVKGLTTAASLWATACIGLAVGSGFYIVSIFSTFLVIVILLFFSKFERYVNKRSNQMSIKVITVNRPGQIGKIGTMLGKLNVSITNISLEPAKDDYIAVILTIRIPRKLEHSSILENLSSLEGINLVEIIDD